MMALVQCQNHRMIFPQQRRNRLKSETQEDENHTSTNDENDSRMLKILKNISKIEEADGGNESDTPLFPKERKLSDCDRFNFDIFKLNTSACLQKDFERLHKEKRKKMKTKAAKE